ncbi:MAG: hypothetical protein FIA98_13680 [Anaerolineae bacterium]|nr:hypothetical protein [Anaerolineae bacterium]
MHKPRFSFQQVFLHTQLVQRGHWIKSGLISSTALRKASSWAFSQEAERIFSPALERLLRKPPKILLAVDNAEAAVPNTDGWKRVR